jgi:hypothetical protein
MFKLRLVQRYYFFEKSKRFSSRPVQAFSVWCHGLGTVLPRPWQDAASALAELCQGFTEGWYTTDASEGDYQAYSST